jgi:phosphoribosylformylglycinamidine synthase
LFNLAFGTPKTRISDLFQNFKLRLIKMQYQATVRIEQKAGMLDPEGTTAKRALGQLGYNVSSVKTAKLYEIVLEAESAENAEQKVDEMCQKLIANPIIHNYTIELKELN